MKNVIVRAISGTIYVALIVGAILAGWSWFFALIALFAFIAISEYDLMVNNGQIYPVSYTLDALAAVGITFLPNLTVSYGWTSIAIVAAIYLPIYFILRIITSLYQKSGDPFVRIAKSFLGVVYIGVPLMALNQIYLLHEQYAHWLVLIIFITIWLNDTGAFCFGITLGKHRLFERLSPKKSWEGFWGGLACCIGFGIACHYIFPDVPMAVWKWITLAIVIAVFATWGDLFESMIKRRVGVKDSSHLIPGHGGILDRIDSLLLVAPAALLCLLIML